MSTIIPVITVILFVFRCNSVTANLTCYCNVGFGNKSNNSDVPTCIETKETGYCKFESLVKRVPRHGGGTTALTDDLATCVAMNHPNWGVVYACAWGSKKTERSCSVVEEKGVVFEMCRCNTKNYCNEDFFDDEVDVSAVETTQLIPQRSPSTPAAVVVDSRRWKTDANNVQRQQTPSPPRRKTALFEVAAATENFTTKNSDNDDGVATPAPDFLSPTDHRYPAYHQQLKPTPQDVGAVATDAAHADPQLPQQSAPKNVDAHREGTNNGDPVNHSNLVVVVPANPPPETGAKANVVNSDHDDDSAKNQQSASANGANAIVSNNNGVNLIILKLVALTIVFAFAIPGVIMM